MDAIPSLSGPALQPRSGAAPRHIVVLLHGVGADGQDLIGLGAHWGAALPHALFLAPDGPEPCDMAPHGRQWFSLADRAPAAIAAGAKRAAPMVDAFLDAALSAHGLPEAALLLCGFSQGAMTALFTGLRRARPPAGIVAYSGALAGADALAREIAGRPPVLLVHGTDDGVVPFAAMGAARAALAACGVPVETLPRPGLGHGIDEAGLAAGLAFARRVLRA
jgi:phospholipase/carboxylesterase